MAKSKASKPPILRWRGLLADASRLVRAVTATVLVVASAALTFTQFGFTGIGFGGEYSAYAITVLQPVALTALLLGTFPGFAVGLFAGGVLCAHSMVAPLSYYELAFVTPATSFVMLAVTGFMLGVLFAFVLRHDPPLVRRTVYIVIVCVVVSWLYSIGFLFNVFVALVITLAESNVADAAGAQLVEVAQAEAITTAMRLGDIGLQAWIDAALMALFGILADAAVRRARAAGEDVGVRAVFGTWLFAVVLIAFMVTAPVSFMAITANELSSAESRMNGEIRYIEAQLDQVSQRVQAMGDFVDQTGIDVGSLNDDELDTMINAMEFQSLLTGYDMESDGLVVVAHEDYVFMSDDEDIKAGDSLSERLGPDAIAALEYSLATGTMQRTVYDMGGTPVSTLDEVGDSVIRTQLAYVMAQEADGDLTVMVLRPSSMVFQERGTFMRWITLIVLVLLVVVFLLTFRLLDRVVGKRIDEANGVLGRIVEGNLNARVKVNEPREFASLSAGINNTVDALQKWIAEAETRMDAELATAKAIQESALPCDFPPFPDIDCFDIYASMKTAKEVGGDFYDFFIIEDGRLGFVMADVSGKGIPAALFMMTAKTQVRTYMESGIPVGEAIDAANHQLCLGNDAGMFVTLFACVLEYETGRLTYVNAGHNPPLVLHDGAWEWMRDVSGMPLGLFDGIPYGQFERQLETGDMLYLYTDGVTEAMNLEGELFGEERLQDTLRQYTDMNPRSACVGVRRAITDFTKDCEQSDDITMLGLKYGVPPETKAVMVLPADDAQLVHVFNYIHAELKRRNAPKSAYNPLDIAAEELFVNVCHYAYPDATPGDPGEVRIAFEYVPNPPSLTVEIADDGVPYNPLEKPDAATADEYGGVADVPIGGLGILMAKKSVDSMEYRREGGSNILTFSKGW